MPVTVISNPAEPLLGVTIMAGPLTIVTSADAESSKLFPLIVIVYGATAALPTGATNPPDISPPLTEHVSVVAPARAPGSTYEHPVDAGSKPHPCMYTVCVSIATIGVVHGPLLLREKPML
jgi:hypothetical protein